tara:strand:- start:399 stop:896 length:498 start_codon:yes stop_codon:yes gene_type:complete
MLKIKTNNKKETKMKNMFKGLIASLMVMMFMTSTAMANQTGPVERPSVYHHFKNVITQVPYNVEVCRQTGSSGGASSADVFIGAIIGGAIGNQIGKGKGNDAATILGAILGADHANKTNPGSTGGTVCGVETRYKEEVTNVYSHSRITWMIDGVAYQATYIHQFN